MKRSARRKFKKNKPSKIFIGIVALVILICLIILGKSISFISSLNKPLSPDSAVIYKPTNWNGRGVINTAILADKNYILSFNPYQKSLLVLKIPDETYLSVPFNFGKWSLGSVYKLGQSESAPMGASLYKKTLEENLGIPINGYIIDQKDKQSFEKTLETLRQNPLENISFLRKVKTDLSFLEYWKLFWSLKGVRFDKVKILDLGDSDLTSWTILRDGSRVISLDQDELDNYIQKYFADSKITDEGLSIGVYNTTDHSGLAEKAARLIENMGGRVVFIANSKSHLDQSIVLGTKSYTFDILNRIFGQNLSSKPQNLDSSRADINLFLGEDYFMKYNSK
ncbi:MAG: LCP family protein [Candidatus Daviesbacteria bacterium]|nr:LCP family protein [Candidatus Daviesbacteria bacterium]